MERVELNIKQRATFMTWQLKIKLAITMLEYLTQMRTKFTSFLSKHATSLPKRLKTSMISMEMRKTTKPSRT